MPSKHAKYGPSSMARIMACPASVELQLQSPPMPESPYAAEGTRAHELAEQMLMSPDADYIPEQFEEGMVEAVRIYADYCNPRLDVAEQYGIEARLTLDDDLFGTADLWTMANRILEVVDYKHGSGVIVSPKENKQGMTYAGLVFDDPSIPIKYDDVDKVRITIVQPRGQGEPTQTWECVPSDIATHMNAVDEAINAAEGPKPPVKMGEHCRFCKAKLLCPAMKKAEEGVAAFDVNDISPKKLGALLTSAHILEGKIKDIYAYAESRIEQGEKVTGWKLVAKRSTRKWTDIKAVMAWCKRNGKMNVMHKKALLSVAQASKVLTESEFKTVSNYMDSTSSGTTIAPRSDKREEVSTPGASLAALGQRLNN